MVQRAEDRTKFMCDACGETQGENRPEAEKHERDCARDILEGLEELGCCPNIKHLEEECGTPDECEAEYEAMEQMARGQA